MKVVGYSINRSPLSPTLWNQKTNILTIGWIPGHRGIDGNEEANRHTKGGLSKNLPMFKINIPVIYSLENIKHLSLEPLRQGT